MAFQGMQSLVLQYARWALVHNALQVKEHDASRLVIMPEGGRGTGGARQQQLTSGKQRNTVMPLTLPGQPCSRSAHAQECP